MVVLTRAMLDLPPIAVLPSIEHAVAAYLRSYRNLRHYSLAAEAATLIDHIASTNLGTVLMHVAGTG